MTNRQRRHPAQASRVLAAGLSAATMLGIVALLGVAAPADLPEGSGAVTPLEVAVVVRVPGVETSSRRTQPSQVAKVPDTSTRPS